MAIGFGTATGNARLAGTFTAAVSGQSVDGGSGVGSLVIGTSSLSGSTGVLATIPLQKPSVSISAKVASLLGVPFSASPSANGAAALGEFRDSAGNTIVSGLTVGTSGTNIIVASTTVSTAIPLVVTSGAITEPPDRVVGARRRKTVLVTSASRTTTARRQELHRLDSLPSAVASFGSSRHAAGNSQPVQPIAGSWRRQRRLCWTPASVDVRITAGSVVSIAIGAGGAGPASSSTNGDQRVSARPGPADGLLRDGAGAGGRGKRDRVCAPMAVSCSDGRRQLMRGPMRKCTLRSLTVVERIATFDTDSATVAACGQSVWSAGGRQPSTPYGHQTALGHYCGANLPSGNSSTEAAITESGVGWTGCDRKRQSILMLLRWVYPSDHRVCYFSGTA